MSYSVGLQNVGSYQVSGRPWSKTISIAAGASEVVEFPNVTKRITIKFKEDAPGNTMSLAFAEPRRSINMPPTPHKLLTSISNSEEFTVSLWAKFDTSVVAKRLVELDDSGGTPDNQIRIQNGGAGNGQLYLVVGNSTVTSISDQVLTAGEWFNLTLVTSSGSDNRVYFNGERVITDTTDVPVSSFNRIFFGGEAVGHEDSYANMCLFGASFSDDEVLELYSSSSKLSPTRHSRSSDLISWWACEDNFYKQYFSTPDTGLIIYDRVSNNNLDIDVAFGTLQSMTFQDGFAMDNAFANHSVTLAGDVELTLNVKTKHLLIQSSHNDDVSIFASLTNIPSSRMYDLTGPGIDE